MKCRQCGNIISPGAKYCAYCGAPLFVPRDASILPRVPAWVMLLTVLIIIGAAAGATAVLFWPSDSATSPAYYKPTTSISTPVTTKTVLVAPRLISPVQGAMFDNGSADFSDNLVWSFDWNDVPGATYYHLYVISQNSPSPAINKSNINSSSYTHNSGYASAGCIWTWQVRAYVGGQWTPWSGQRTFCVEPVNSDTEKKQITPTPTVLEGCDNYADLGNPNDEQFHNLKGWERKEAFSQATESGDKTVRFQSIRALNSLYLCVPKAGIDYTLTVQTHDGSCDDSFWIYINDQGPIYKYEASANRTFNPLHSIYIGSQFITSTDVKITFKNTAHDSCGLAGVYFVKLDPSVPLDTSDGSTSASSVDISYLEGNWQNIDLNTSGITRIEIYRVDPTHLSIHPWGKCHPTDCDWGARTYEVSSVPFTIDWIVSFAEEQLSFSLIDDSVLQVNLFTHFTDASGRSDYWETFKFSESHTTTTPNPTNTSTKGTQYLVMSASNRICFVNPVTNAVVKTIPAPCSRPESLAWDGECLWVASFDGAKVYRVTLDGNINRSFQAPNGTQPNGLAWDGECLWMSSYMKNPGIYQLDPNTGSVIAKYQPPGAPYQGYGGLAFDNQGFLWHCDAYGSGIYKFNPVNFTSELIMLPAPDKYSQALAWDGVYLWTGGYPSYKVFKLDPTTGAVIASNPSPIGDIYCGMTFITLNTDNP